MTIPTELYHLSLKRLPQNGRHIIACQDENSLLVYQAYKNSIADYAVTKQQLGGPDFNYQRMSWIKPNFLWMMYRCGWAEKKDQERVLALWISKTDFEKILSDTVFSAFKKEFYDSSEQWKNELLSKNVRLQWDPDHDPFGRKVERRAIQLGLKGETLKYFGRQQVQKIEDITVFVKQQKQMLKNNQSDKLLVPVETIFQSLNTGLNKKIGITGSLLIGK